MEIEQLKIDLIRYLSKFPESGDTLDGIAVWWMLQQHVSDKVEQVQATLELLVREGVIKKRVLPGGMFLYQVERKDESSS